MKIALKVSLYNTLFRYIHQGLVVQNDVVKTSTQVFVDYIIKYDVTFVGTI